MWLWRNDHDAVPLPIADVLASLRRREVSPPITLDSFVSDLSFWLKQDPREYSHDEIEALTEAAAESVPEYDSNVPRAQ